MASPRVVLITGGNEGIGWETVKALLESQKPYHIFMGSRSMEKAELAMEKLRKECPKVTNTVETLQVDVTSDESIEKAFEKVQSSRGYIDTLLNNAGATFDLKYVAGELSLRECFDKAYSTNVSGTNVMTHTFMPLLLKSSDPQLMFVTGLSMMTLAAKEYFPTPPQPAGWPKKIAFETIGYRCSKTALNMLVLDWNHKLRADGVKVWGVGPGMVATNLGGSKERAKAMGAGEASTAGIFFRSVIEGERDADVGKLIQKEGITPF